MITILTLIACGVFAWFAWWWFYARNRPDFPPLSIDEDDPLMIDARRKAKETVPTMLALFSDAKDSTSVKIPFTTSSGVVEHLWAELLEVDGENIKVRYTTPPVSHSGHLERLQTHALSDVEDWVVTKDPDRYQGGFSTRVMFTRGREQWGDLPPALAAEERKYV